MTKRVKLSQSLHVEEFSQSLRGSVPNGVSLSKWYISDWNDDVVELNPSADRHGKTSCYDFNNVFLRCTGPASPFDGIRPITQFTNLRDTLKIFLNNLAVTFHKSSKGKSEISRNFNAVIRFCSWSIQHRGIVKLSDLTKHDFEDFVDAFVYSKYGILEITGCIDGLEQLLEEVKSGFISPETICGSDKYRTKEFIIHSGFLSKYLGIPCDGLHIPEPFLSDLAHLCGKDPKVGHTLPTTKTNTVYAYLKALNRLWDLPSNIDRPSIKPYPKPYQLIKTIEGFSRGGRTENIRPEDAITIIESAIQWVFSYGDAIVKIVESGRQLALDISQGRRLDFWPNFLERANRISRIYKLPFEIVEPHSPLRNSVDTISADDLTSGLMTACFCLVAINHGRRLNEIIGVYGLEGGLYFGCFMGESPFPEIGLVEFYVEKTLQDWAVFPANKLVQRVVILLESLAQEFRSLNEPVIHAPSDRKKARKIKLFRRRIIIGDSAWTGDTYNFIYSRHSAFFFGRLKLSSKTLDARSHPFRRIFSVVYYYRYENPRLLALSAQLRHLFPSTTQVYVTDPAMRATADRLNQMYAREQISIDEEVQSESPRVLRRLQLLRE